jgi:hypothetical protein
MPGMESGAVAEIERMLKATPLRDSLRNHPETTMLRIGKTPTS